MPDSYDALMFECVGGQRWRPSLFGALIACKIPTNYCTLYVCVCVCVCVYV